MLIRCLKKLVPSLFIIGSCVTVEAKTSVYNAKLLRPSDPKKCIFGLTLVSDTFPIKIKTIQPLEFYVIAKFQFVPMSRTLLVNDSPLKMGEVKPGAKVNFNVEIASNRKVKSLKITAISSEGDIEEEELILKVEDFEAMKKNPFKLSKESGGEIGIVPNYSFFSLDSTQKSNSGKAFIVSKLLIGIKVLGSYHITDKLAPNFLLGIRYYDFLEPEGRTFRSGSGSKISPHFGLGLQYYFIPELSSGLFLEYTEELVLLSTDSNILTLNYVGLPKLGVSLNFIFLKLKLLRLGTGFLFYYQFGKNETTYNIRPTVAYIFELLIEFIIKNNYSLKFAIYGTTHNTDTSLTLQKHVEIGTRLQISISF